MLQDRHYPADDLDKITEHHTVDSVSDMILPWIDWEQRVNDEANTRREQFSRISYVVAPFQSRNAFSAYMRNPACCNPSSQNGVALLSQQVTDSEKRCLESSGIQNLCNRSPPADFQVSVIVCRNAHYLLQPK